MWDKPHFDKSVLTLIWDSDDDNNDCLLICENTKNPNLKALKKPERRYAQSVDQTSAILIGGLALPIMRIDVEPTLHGVALPKKEYRHAIISFMLLPGIDMSDWQTDFVQR